MADIFISYAREDKEAARKLAQVLEAAGYSCWWDQNLASGARYLKETEAELKASKVVLVIWSRASIESYWVADEAAVGRDENRMAAISFDGTMPPLGFRQFQVTDFSTWSGDAKSPSFASLLAAIDVIERSGSARSSAAVVSRSDPGRRPSIFLSHADEDGSQPGLAFFKLGKAVRYRYGDLVAFVDTRRASSTLLARQLPQPTTPAPPPNAKEPPPRRKTRKSASSAEGQPTLF